MKKTYQQDYKKAFTRGLIRWNNQQNNRQMPWKGEKDPYKIWLSEIILQQTRVDQGLAYYSNFVKAFPDIHTLAAAPDEKVFKLWEGLGYYSRCRNLLFTARFIASNLKGKFPDTYETIKALKGVGPYTAAAISSFAYNLPYAVVDGNVFRVLARVFGISIPTDSTEGKKQFTALANELIDQKGPGAYNQAIMDFGATVCKPVSPVCSGCVFNKKCIAFLEKRISALPVKEKKISIKKRWFYYLVMEYKGSVAIRKRTQKDIWQDLYEFPLIESANELSRIELDRQLGKQEGLGRNAFELKGVSPLNKQQLSHQLITGQFIHLQLKKKPQPVNSSAHTGWQWVKKGDLGNYAWPKFINQYIESGSSATGFQ
jgi:A/G-specific adenine glycosylase